MSLAWFQSSQCSSYRVLQCPMPNVHLPGAVLPACPNVNVIVKFKHKKCAMTH